MTAKPATDRPPKLTHEELARYIIADLSDDLLAMETWARTLRKQADSALAALQTANRNKDEW
jgi:hypothetical protein